MIECDRIREQRGGCPTGQAVITSAGNLPARFVIHTVGPIWNGGKNNEKQITTAMLFKLFAAGWWSFEANSIAR